MTKYNIHTNTLGLGRSILAIGSFLTLILNSYYVLFPEYHFVQVQSQISGIEKLNLFLLFDYGHIAIPYYIALLILVLVVSGTYPRLTCLLHAWVSYSIYHSLLIIEGGDQITAILSLLLIPICLLDKRSNHWGNKIEDESKTPFFLRYFCYCTLIFLHFQMSFLYLDAAVEKLKVAEWTEGTAVYFWINHNIFGAPMWLRELSQGLLANPLIMTIVNWGVITLEMLLFTANFLNMRHKYNLFIAGFLFHFSIFIVHGLPTFWIGMTGGLILYLWRLDFTITQNLRIMSTFFTHSFKKIDLKTIKTKYQQSY